MASNDTNSYAEDLLSEALNVLLTRKTYYQRNCKPKFMRSPTTGRRLELDAFIPSVKLAFEVQGPSHFEDPAQMERDRLKVQLTDSAGVKLIPLRLSEVTVTEVYGHIHNRARELEKSPWRYVRPLHRVPEGVARQKRAVRAYVKNLYIRYGETEALGDTKYTQGVQLTAVDRFLQQARHAAYVEYQLKKDSIRRRARILGVEDGRVLLRVGGETQYHKPKNLKAPVFY